MVMMTNPFAKFPNQPTDNFFERLGGSTLKSPESNTTSNITWSTTGKVGWDISGTTISRTGSAGWSTSKIQSTDTFTVGDEEFLTGSSGIANDLNTTMIGLNKGTLGYHYGGGSPQNNCDFAIYVAGGSRVEVYESGTKNYDSGGSRNANDKFRIEVDIDGVVKYYLQEGGTGSFDLKHTSSSTASGTYFIQANAYADTSEVTVHSKTVTIPASPRIKTHFIEWFSGKKLPSYWTLQNNTALPTVAMQDSVDGGLLMTNTGTGTGGSITFNNKRQYGGSSNCTCIMVLKSTGGNTGLTYAGFDRNGYPSSSASSNSTAVIEMGASTYFNLVVTNAGSGWDRTATSIATADANWHNVKIDVKASDVDLTIDGTLEATRTGVRPTTTMQPCVTGRNAGSNALTHIRYMECYNT